VFFCCLAAPRAAKQQKKHSEYPPGLSSFQIYSNIGSIFMAILVEFIHITARVLALVVLVDIILSYFVSPFNPVRLVMDRIVEPMLAPIRRFVPTMGMIDFSPIILIILIQVLDILLSTILLSIG
jgi:YggT family protein